MMPDRGWSAPGIPGFEIVERLGEGGMGVVYRARQVALDRWVAIKVLRDELAQEPEYVRRFLREARLAGRLRHANIVSALDCGEAGGRSYMVMEFVEGQPLDRLLRSRGPLAEPEALEIARGVAEALQYAWGHRIIHRDLKPQNVLLTKEGVPKVCDFGLCRDVRDLPHLTSLGLIHCTPEYASPEQARGDKDVDTRSDLYSLGVTLYEMLTGSIPFEAPDAATLIVKHAMDRPRPPMERNRSISAAVNRLILDLLEKAREERPASPAAVIERIHTIGAPGRGGSSSSRVRITRSWRTTSRRPGSRESRPPVGTQVGLGLAALGLLVAWALARRPAPPPEPRRLRSPSAAESLEPSPEEVRKQNLSAFLRAFELGDDGIVNHWLTLGPLADRGFDSPVVRQVEGNDPVPGLEFARLDGTMTRWRRTEAAGGALDFSDLETRRDEPHSSLVLAATWLECREDVQVEIQFTSTGAFELHLDRRVLASSRAGDRLRQRIALGHGWHSLLVLVARAEGKATIGLRILTPEGGRPAGLKVWH